MYVYRLILLAIGLSNICSAFAEPVIHSKTRHYEFTAATREEIWHRISQAGGVDAAADGTNHLVRVAWTAFNLQLNYSLSAALFQCRLHSYQPILYVTVTLPHWKNKWQADQVLAENWDNYVRMVSKHENVHKDYAVKTAHELDKRLAEIGVMKSCKDLKAKIEQTRQDVLAQNYLDNKWFDAKERVYQQKLKWF